MAGGHRPRPGRLRRDGLPLDGARRRALLRPARPRLRGRQGRLPGPRSNSYLYGGRFMSYLAYQYSPEHGGRGGWSAGDGSKAYYASQFREVFGMSLEQAWRDWIAWEREFQQTNLEAIRELPHDAVRGTSRTQALGSVSRAYLDAATASSSTPPSTTPASSPTWAPSRSPDGSVRKLADIKGPAIYTVTSLAYDPETDTLFYTTDNNAFRDLVLARPGDREVPDAPEGRADRRPRLRPGRPVALGHPHLQRHLHARPHPLPLDRVEARPLLALRRGPLRPRRLAGRQAPLRLGRRDRRPADRSASSRRSALREGRRDAAGRAGVRLRRAIPSNFVFSPDGRYLYGSSYYTGVSNIFRYELATRSPRGGQQHRDRLLPPAAPRATTASSSSATPARASCPPRSRRSRSRT